MKCSLCGANKFQIVFETTSWQAKKCLKCDLVVINREKNEVSYDFYHRDDDYKKLESHFRNIFQKRVNIINKLKPKPGAVLEVGCSNGVMLDIFKHKGWETWGVEPSENAEYAIDKGHKIFQTVFESVNINTDYFDVVILNHTLEHLENPLKVMHKIHSLVKKDGIVVIDVPNFGSLGSRIFGKYWKHLLPEEHNFQFSQKSLANLMEKANFEVVHFESRSGIFEFANPLGELYEAFSGLKKRFVFTLFNLPYAIVATLINKGDSMTMVGRK